METYLIWLILGMVLITVEMMSGTFYLLVLGLAALVASALGYAGGGFSTQAACASIVAVVGVLAVNRWRKKSGRSTRMNDNVDFGQPVVFESWVNETARLMRVKYRGTSWDAHLQDAADARTADVLYICGTQGSRLEVCSSKPGVTL